jgi:hypothetical protein
MNTCIRRILVLIQIIVVTCGAIVVISIVNQ